jgi:hypothetical protein
MINGTGHAATVDLDTLMERVRDVVARRKEHGPAETTAAVSLDLVLRRQMELNGALVRAVTMLSAQIGELKQTVEAAATLAATPGAATPIVNTPATNADGLEQLSPEQLARLIHLAGTRLHDYAALVVRQR